MLKSLCLVALVSMMLLMSSSPVFAISSSEQSEKIKYNFDKKAMITHLENYRKTMNMIAIGYMVIVDGVKTSDRDEITEGYDVIDRYSIEQSNHTDVVAKEMNTLERDTTSTYVKLLADPNNSILKRIHEEYSTLLVNVVTEETTKSKHDRLTSDFYCIDAFKDAALSGKTQNFNTCASMLKIDYLSLKAFVLKIERDLIALK